MQVLYDLRYVLRLLRKTPSFTGITLLVIVLGLSLYIMSSSVVEVMTDKSMPFENGERYVSLKTQLEGSGLDQAFENHDYFTYNYLRERANSYSVLGAFSESTFSFSDGDYSSSYFGVFVDPNLISVTDIQPILGRVLSPVDTAPNAERVALIGYSVWQEYYGGRDDVIGAISRIEGQPYSIIGVMPEGFSFPMAYDVWLPLPEQLNILPAEGRALTLVGVLGGNIDASSAEVELNVLISQLAIDYPESYENRIELVRPYASMITPDGLGLDTMISTITLIILALAIINLSALLFVRSSSRQQELAVRASVGASGWELAKQVLLESLVICSFGLLLSLLLSELLLRGLNGLFLNSIGVLPFWFDLKLDSQTVLTGVFCTVVVWLASCMVTAYKAYKSQPGAILNASGKGAVAQHGSALMTRLIVGVEVVLSCFLLISCGVVIYLVQLVVTNYDYGADISDYVVGGFSLAGEEYIEPQQRLRFINDFRRGLLEIPELSNASIITAPLGMRGQPGTYQLEDRDVLINQQAPLQQTIWLDDNYFSMLGINAIEGRIFDSADIASSNPLVIISEEFAQQLWPNESAVGKRIRSNIQADERWLTVIGVIPRLLQASIDLNVQPSLYRPITQDTPSNYFLLAIPVSPVGMTGLDRGIATTIANIDRNIPLKNFRTLEEELNLDQGAIDVIALIFVFFTAGALILAGTGIYGVIARSISLRTQEIGVCRALGSSDYRVMRRFLMQGLAFLLIGALLGGGSAYLIVGNIFSSLDITSGLKILNIIASLVLVALALMIGAASYIPARKAILLEPGDALRYE